MDLLDIAWKQGVHCNQEGQGKKAAEAIYNEVETSMPLDDMENHVLTGEFLVPVADSFTCSYLHTFRLLTQEAGDGPSLRNKDNIHLFFPEVKNIGNNRHMILWSQDETHYDTEAFKKKFEQYRSFDHTVFYHNQHALDPTIDYQPAWSRRGDHTSWLTVLCGVRLALHVPSPSHV